MIRPKPMRGPGMTKSMRVVTSSSVDSGLATRPATKAERAALQGIAANLGAVITQAAATTLADPLARMAAGGDAADDVERPAEPAGGPAPFSEGTQALLDRLERLGDMRDRGLLTADEFEAAKATIVVELEARA
jgi:Short C-terminal domain